MYIEIDSYEAKTKLPELLRGIQNGKRYTITLSGNPIADLIPSENAASIDAVNAVAHMKNFILNVKPVKGVDINALINEGRE